MNNLVLLQLFNKYIELVVDSHDLNNLSIEELSSCVTDFLNCEDVFISRLNLEINLAFDLITGCKSDFNYIHLGKLQALKIDMLNAGFIEE